MTATGQPDLRGKRLLVVFGTYDSKKHLYQRVRELGVKIAVLDGPGHWTESSELIETFLGVDLRRADSLFERSMQAIRSSALRIDAVATFDEFAGPLAARIAEALGLPGHPLRAVRTARDKELTRRACHEAHLGSCRFARVKTESNLDSVAASVGFPAILKPVSGVGTVQTYLVTSAAELGARWNEVMAALPQEDGPATVQSDEGWYDLMWATDRHMLLEQVLDGPKYDADCLLSNGRCVYMEFVLTQAAEQLRDTRRILPATLTAPQRIQLRDYVAATLNTIGFINGVFNVEAVMTTDGPVLVEVNARMSGHGAYEMHKTVWGVDLVEEYLRICAGQSIAPVVAETPMAHVAESLLPAPNSGVVRHTDFLRRFEGAPNVVVARPFVKRGQQVTGPEDGAPDWMGDIVTRGVTAEEAARTLDAIIDQVEFPIDRTH